MGYFRKAQRVLKFHGATHPHICFEFLQLSEETSAWKVRCGLFFMWKEI